MKRTLISPVLLLVPVLVLGCDTGEEMTDEAAPAAETATPVDETATEAEVGDVRDAWLEAAEDGDPATVAALYSADAVMVGADGEPAQGRRAIQESLTEGLAGLVDLEITSTGTELGRDLVTDMGTFTQTFQTPEGGEQTVNGRYIVVLRRQSDGEWRITQHLSSFQPSPEDAM